MILMKRTRMHVQNYMRQWRHFNQHSQYLGVDHRINPSSILVLDPHKTEYKQMQFLYCCGFSFANKPLPLEHISLLFTVCDSVWFHCCPGWNDRVYMRSLAARRNYHLQSGFIATYFSICVSALFYVATSHLSTETFKKYIHLMT